jgi:hypothetical protein
MPVAQLIGTICRARVSSSVREDVPAGAEPEATSPETDTPTRLFAEICYPLYQERAAGNSSICGFQRVFFGLLPVTYGGSIVGMLCINQDQDEM